MALREFEDGNGVTWRVWSVAIDHAYSQGVREGYLGDLQYGWLCFEAGPDRRRLAKYPEDWESLSEDALCELLEQATPAPRRRLSGDSEEAGS